MKIYLVGTEATLQNKTSLGDTYISCNYFKVKGFCFTEKDAKHLMMNDYMTTFAEEIAIPVEVNKTDIIFSRDSLKEDIEKSIAGTRDDNGKEASINVIKERAEKEIKKIIG